MSNAINYNLIYLCLSHSLCVYARVRKVSNWSCKVSQVYLYGWQKQKTIHVNWKQTLAVNRKGKKWFNSKENKNKRNDYKLKIQQKKIMKSTNFVCVFLKYPNFTSNHRWSEIVQHSRWKVLDRQYWQLGFMWLCFKWIVFVYFLQDIKSPFTYISLHFLRQHWKVFRIHRFQL